MTRAASALVASLVCLAGAARAQEPSPPAAQDAGAARRDAVVAWRAGHAERAFLLWRLHLARQPRDDETRAAFARALASRKHYAEAKTELRAVLTRHPSDVEVRATLARILGWTKDYAAALAEVERALAIEPRHRESRLVKADLLSWSRRFAAAVPHYLIALELGDEREVRRRLTRTLVEAKYYDRALLEARRLLLEAPHDLELRELARVAEEALLVGDVEVALSTFEAGRVHPWWRAQVSTRWSATSTWRIGLGIEHYWRDFQPRNAPAPPGVSEGFVRDTTLAAEGAYQSKGPWSAYFQLVASPQATFNPRVAFEGAFGYELRRGLAVGASYKGYGYDGQYAQLLVPTVTWHFGSYVLVGRYYFAAVHPFNDAVLAGRAVSTSVQVGHAASVRLRGDVLPKLSFAVSVGGGLSFVTAGLGPVTNPSISAGLGVELRPTPKNGLRLDYEYLNEQFGDGARYGVAWHGVRIAYVRRY